MRKGGRRFTTRDPRGSSRGSRATPAQVSRRRKRQRGRASEAIERALTRVGDLKECVELGELEQRLQIVIEVRETQLSALLADLLGKRYENTKAGAVDVAGLREVDEELLLAPLELVQHLLLQLLAIADDELSLHINHDDVSLPLDRETHVAFS